VLVHHTRGPAVWTRSSTPSGAPDRTRFQHFEAGYLIDWHNPPTRRFILFLSGMAEVMAGDGEARRFGPGCVLLCDDMTGRGHQVCGIEDFVITAVPV
jgi:hypothetical protein